MDDQDYLHFERTITILLNDLLSRRPLDEFLSDDTLSQLSAGRKPDRLNFKRDVLSECLMECLCDYLNDLIGVEAGK